MTNDEQDEPRLVLRDFHITRLESPDYIWIGRTNGEGGAFLISDFERVIKGFYEENF